MSQRFEIIPASIPEVTILVRRPIGDHRGFLERMFCVSELADLIPSGKSIVQINRTLTSERGVVRGMHFQNPPYAETKFVSCLKGEIFDVAVDIRPESPTYLQWHAEVLSAENGRTLVIPEGFAHGFQTLVPDCELLYFHTAVHDPASEGALNALDPVLGIPWPLEVTAMSQRDQSHPLLNHRAN